MDSQLLLRTQRKQCGRYTHKRTYKRSAYKVHNMNGFMVIGGWFQVDVWLDLMLFHFCFWKYGFHCLYEWPSSGYDSILSLLTCHSRFYGGYYGKYCLFDCFVAPWSVAGRGSVAYMVYLSDIWLQLGWCIISLRWWSFHTQLDIPAECTWMRPRHTWHTLTTMYISSWMYLYSRI